MKYLKSKSYQKVSEIIFIKIEFSTLKNDLGYQNFEIFNSLFDNVGRIDEKKLSRIFYQSSKSYFDLDWTSNLKFKY